MLYTLSQPSLSGKTRWLEDLVQTLKEYNIPCYGFICPGIWQKEDGRYNKLGIACTILSSTNTYVLAQKAKASSETLGLRWTFNGKTIAEVNHYCLELKEELHRQSVQSDIFPGLLILDEIGPLELKYKRGFIEALSLLEAGPNRRIPHALCVIRESLRSTFTQNLITSWPETEALDISHDSIKKLVQLYKRG